MAPRGGKKAVKRGGKKPARKGARKSKAHVTERASCKESQTFTLLNGNQVYTNYNTQLSSFLRARTIAEGYQFYRIKRITYKFSPLSDTFAVGSGTTVPYLYFMIDRLAQLSVASTAQQLRAMGAKPKRMDDKIITWSYAPSVRVASFDSLPPIGQSQTQFTQYKVSPWLSCRDAEGPGAIWQADSTDHLGCVWLLENSGGGNVPYKCERIVEFEFKKPSFQVIQGPNDPPPIDVETILDVPPAP